MAQLGRSRAARARARAPDAAQQHMRVLDARWWCAAEPVSRPDPKWVPALRRNTTCCDASGTRLTFLVIDVRIGCLTFESEARATHRNHIVAANLAFGYHGGRLSLTLSDLTLFNLAPFARSAASRRCGRASAQI
jgi:hypothetical protein